LAALADIVKKHHRFNVDFKCSVPLERAAFAADLFIRMARLAGLKIAIRSTTSSDGSPISVRFEYDNREQTFEVEQSKYLAPSVFLEAINNLLAEQDASHRLRVIAKDYVQWVARLEPSQIAALENAGFRIQHEPQRTPSRSP